MEKARIDNQKIQKPSPPRPTVEKSDEWLRNASRGFSPSQRPTSKGHCTEFCKSKEPTTKKRHAPFVIPIPRSLRVRRGSVFFPFLRLTSDGTPTNVNSFPVRHLTSSFAICNHPPSRISRDLCSIHDLHSAIYQSAFRSVQFAREKLAARAEQFHRKASFFPEETPRHPFAITPTKPQIRRENVLEQFPEKRKTPKIGPFHEARKRENCRRTKTSEINRNSSPGRTSNHCEASKETKTMSNQSQISVAPCCRALPRRCLFCPPERILPPRVPPKRKSPSKSSGRSSSAWSATADAEAGSPALFKQHGGYDMHAVADYFPDVVDKCGDALGVDKKPAFLRPFRLQEGDRKRRGGHRHHHAAVLHSRNRRRRRGGRPARLHGQAGRRRRARLPADRRAGQAGDAKQARVSWSITRFPPIRTTSKSTKRVREGKAGKLARMMTDRHQRRTQRPAQDGQHRKPPAKSDLGQRHRHRRRFDRLVRSC